MIDLVGNEAPKGGSVTLTVDPDAQQAAYDGLKALGDNVRGAVVAIEPRTGKILAMVSSPSYNPNRLASHDFNAVGKAKQRLEEDKLSPLNNRAIEEVLPAGLDLQAGHRGGGARVRQVHPRHAGARRRDPRPAADHHRPRQRERRRLRWRQDHAHPGAGGLVQRLLRRRRASSSAPTRCASRPRSSASAPAPSTTSTTRSTRQAMSRFPEDPDEPQTALSAIGQFDVAATPAADGDGRRRHRQRRRR